MVEIRSIANRDPDLQTFNDDIARELASLGGADFAVLFCTPENLNPEFIGNLAKQLDCPLIGGTSSKAILSNPRADAALTPTVGVLLIRDEDGDFGTGVAKIGDDPETAAKRAIHEALENAGCAGELPALIWIYQAPGNEEQVIEGLRAVVGDGCPIIGGSSADNDLSGQWRQISNHGVHENSVVVGALFPSGGVGYAFGSGYVPMGKSGVVCMTDPRCIKTIDGRPAAEVYNEWSDGSLNGLPENGGLILENTALHPLGVAIPDEDGSAKYALIHPESVTPEKSVTTFANVDDGSTISAMSGTTAALEKRLGRVALEAKEYIDLGNGEIAGALAIYCAGCMMALDDDTGALSDSMAQALPDVPFLGAFTFGEQGFLAGRNIHGNLMISVVMFGR